jgi:rod shape-determining protein MreD
MARLSRQPWCVATALAVPLLAMASPGLLKLAGVSPSWAVLWLLPWALVDGPVSGALAGFGIGLMLDGLNLGGASQIPALALLGWWWGRISRTGPPVERSFSLGLLALLGTLLLNLSLMLQFTLQGSPPDVLLISGVQIMLAQTLITALLAPMLCSLLLLLWRQQTSSLRG